MNRTNAFSSEYNKHMNEMEPKIHDNFDSIATTREY